MTSETRTTGGMDSLTELFFPWLGASAPQSLTQPILPDWSLIRITENNSSAPDTERRILEKDSYGRQIGRLLDAVSALVALLPEGERGAEPFAELARLKARVDKAKDKAAADRLGRIKDDVAQLKASADEADKALLAQLRAALKD
jgi:hypothetical protein